MAISLILAGGAALAAPNPTTAKETPLVTQFEKGFESVQQHK